MGPSKYVEQILNIYNYFDGAIIVDRKGSIEYYNNKRQDINTLTNKEIVGKNLFSVYPHIKPQDSTLLEVIRTGKPLINQHQKLINYKGEVYEAIFSTFPVLEQERIVGAVEVFLYLQNRDEYLNIFVMNSELKKENQQGGLLSDIISVSKSMEQLKSSIIKLSKSDSNVLIFGETGTGKELVARAIHTIGRRDGARFLVQNCAAIPENLLESILFGTVKGGFTGAENRMGLFEAANGGTLFLDEVNSMDLGIQAKLLKAIEEQKVTRVGGITEIPVDVRIIAAMNEDPFVCVKKGNLREDLYYRLRVVQLNIPPIRKRREDIVPLTNYYIEFFNRTMGRDIKGISADVEELFYHYDWPGNVRELRNMIEGAFNLCEHDKIQLSDIDVELLSRIKSKHMMDKGSLKYKVSEYERYIIKKTLDECENQVKASKLLGITRQTLSQKIKSYEILNETEQK